MSKRALLIVAMIAIVSIALTFLGNETNDPSSFQGEAFVPEIESGLSEVGRVRVEAGGGETVATLSRTDDGWVVAEKSGYPANVGVIRAALVDLSEAATIEAKTADPEFYDRLGVQDVALESATGIAITPFAGDSALPTVILGDSVGSSYRYARRSDQAQSYLIDRDPEVPRDVAQWLVTDIMNVPGTRVQRITIEHADGERLVLSKSDASQSNFTVADVPEGRELSYPGVANVTGNALRELRLEDVVRAEEDRDPVALIEYVTFDGLVVGATAYMIDEAGWLAFTARFDADQAVEFATDTVDEPLADTEASGDPRAEAEMIERRVSGWLYRIPSYQYGQMTRRMEDLLAAES